MTDASTSIIVNCFLIYPTSSGTKTASLLTHKSYLGAESTSLPRRELQGVAFGASLTHKVVTELGNLISKLYLCTDSKVAVYWVLSAIDKPMQIFNKNRCDVIRSKLNMATECLHDIHVSEELDTEASKNIPSPLDYEKVLHWVPFNYNSADIGSKYATFDIVNNKGSAGKMTSHKDCSPTSAHYVGLPWMKNIELAISSNMIKSARKIKQQEKVGEDDKEIFETGFKKSKMQKLKKKGEVGTGQY